MEESPFQMGHKVNGERAVGVRDQGILGQATRGGG